LVFEAALKPLEVKAKSFLYFSTGRDGSGIEAMAQAAQALNCIKEASKLSDVDF
jgi:hypothetical protein